jgi:prepilin peptidase CpaA
MLFSIPASLVRNTQGDLPVVGYALMLVFPVAMAFAAANDLFTMKIPNKISLALVAAFVLSAVYTRTPLDQTLAYAGTGAVFLAAGFVMFSLRLLGGGDAKLMAAGALWMGPEHALMYVAYVTIFGGLLSAAILAYRRFVPATAMPLPIWAVKLHTRGSGVPYGIAIAAAGLVIYPSTPWYNALLGSLHG